MPHKTPEQRKAYQKAYYHANKAKKNAYNRAYHQANRDALNEAKRVANKARYQANKEARQAQVKAHYQANRMRLISYRVAWSKRRRASDPGFAVVGRLRCRLNFAIRKSGAEKIETTMALVGCTTKQLLAHLEAQFLPGMSWENRGEWHIDHIVPCASFDMTDPAQQRECFHYSNLRPLWAAENIRKGARGVEPLRRGVGHQLCLAV